jgi:trehalose-phosphatase
VALLLDYDGTLAPIAPHPDLAIFPLETKNVLQRLSNVPDVYISIISGRSVDNVMKMVMFCFSLYWEMIRNLAGRVFKSFDVI